MNPSYNWELFVTPGLGDNSYLLQSGEEAVIIDPQRDAWRFLSEADSRKLRIRYVLETHVHNDYVSGALEIRNATRADIAAPAKGNYEFPHRGISEGDEIRIGSLRVVAIETPGHTPEHISWLVYEDGVNQPVAVFSGGSLIVGSAGRTDLLGPKRTQELTHMQFQTIRRFAALPRSVTLLPTHGAGSFCAAGGVGKGRISTLADEIRSNPSLQHNDEQSFIKQQLEDLKSYPTYYSQIAAINRKGAEILGALPSPPAVATGDVSAHMLGGGWVVDARDRSSFARAHIPGSINIELSDEFATYVGWLIPFGSPIVLLLPEPLQQSIEEALTQLIRIGYDNVKGYLAGGINAWQESGSKTGSYPIGTLEDLCQDYNAGNRDLIDVRQEEEWDAGHAQGSIHAFVGDLNDKLKTLPSNREMWVACESGFRASIAASYLDRHGISVRLLADGGISDLLKECPAATAKK